MLFHKIHDFFHHIELIKPTTPSHLGLHRERQAPQLPISSSPWSCVP